MTVHRHGMLLGKFYPPHEGHCGLIEHAARRSGRVTVVVMASAYESVGLEDRVAWLRACHVDAPGVQVVGIRCDIPVDDDDPTAWAAHVALLEAVLPGPVDAVFSGEGYGDELARRLGAVAETWDPGRTRWPVSGTACRADLAGSWHLLRPPVRAGLAARVVVLGAESTGTTTLSRALAAHYRARGGVWARTGWVAEYGREFTYVKMDRAGGADPRDVVWEPADFDEIAVEQNRQEDEAAAYGSPLVVCDTDAFATTVWERRYLGQRPSPARAAAMVGPARHEVYLLTDDRGVPFEQDGIRDGEHVRTAMTGWFRDDLTAHGHSWALLTGTHEQRLRLAVRITDAVLDRRLRLGPPL